MAADKYGALMRQLIRPDWSGVFGSPPAQIKAAMNMLGSPAAGPVRHCCRSNDPHVLDSLRDVLISAGLED